MSGRKMPLNYIMGLMNILKDINLSEYSTMGLGGSTDYLVEVTNREEIREAVTWAKGHNLPCIMIGSGSNIVWRDEGFHGLLIVNSVLRLDIYEETDEDYYVVIGAGEPWDSVVKRCVDHGLSGIECLSLIPGKAGATPIQNVGAYGQELSSSLTTIEAYDSSKDEFVILPNIECEFGYRTSRFKAKEPGRFYIIAITLHLLKTSPKPPFYSALEEYLKQNNIHDYTPNIIRDAVISIRKSKLPDPSVVHNVGSFFANPIVSEYKLTDLREKYNMVPSWPAGERQVKLSAAWLIEKTGYKDFHDEKTGMATWPTQPLVLVNYTARSTADLLAFKETIESAVKSKFDITLVQEPELLPHPSA
jgi:UDP-N-acetylmuramate dehydrogenase